MASAVPEPKKKRPWHHPIRLLQRLVLYAIIIYVMFGLYLFLKQRSFIYPPSDNPIPIEQAYAEAKQAGYVPWPHTTPGAVAPQGYIRPDFDQPAPRGTIVFFHGNGDMAWDANDYVTAWKQRGFRSFLYEYPGYGGRPGLPSEKAIVPDARALVRSLDQAGYGPIYIWGLSLGTGIASAVCADPTLPVHGLALSMPWDTIANVGLSRYPYMPVRLLMTDQYNSIANLQDFKHPICVIYGDRDDTIPPQLTLNLFAHLPNPKKLILQHGYGHGDWPSTPGLGWWDDVLNSIVLKPGS